MLILLMSLMTALMLREFSLVHTFFIFLKNVNVCVNSRPKVYHRF